MRLAGISCLCLILIGCSSQSSKSGGITGALAPGSAATFYSVASNVSGAAPCGTSSASQVLGFSTAQPTVATPALTINSSNTTDRYEQIGIDTAGEIYILSINTAQDCRLVPGSTKILVFAPASSGTLTATPIRTISGLAAHLDGAARMAVDGPGNVYLWENAGSDSAALDTLVQFAAGANGNVAPIRTITLPWNTTASATGIGYPAGLAVDQSGNLFFATSNAPTNIGGVATESDMIEVFTPAQSGSVAPARTISGTASGLAQVSGLSLDGAGNIYVEMSVYATGANPTILEFAGGASGTAPGAPTNQISGTQTMLSRFILDSISVDTIGNIYVLDYTFPGNASATNLNYILRFDAGTTGDAVPVAAQISTALSSASVH